MFAVRQYLAERHFQPRPWVYALLADGILRWNYLFPKKTEIVIDELARIPLDRGVIFAMNHASVYGYLPFMVGLYRVHRSEPERGPLALTAWIKAKYFDSPLLAKLLTRLNMIPLPSRGYLLARDYQDTIGRRLDNESYRLLRDWIDGACSQEAFLAAATPDLRRLATTRHGDFDPQQQPYRDFIERNYKELLTLVTQLSEQALRQRFHLFIFPEGVIAQRLQTGRTGLAQFALRTGATIVPVGANGLDKVYPDQLPFARGGRALYRVGAPISVADALAPFAIPEPFTPFTRDAQERFGSQFQAATDLIMSRINDLLDPLYQYRPEAESDYPDISRLI